MVQSYNKKKYRTELRCRRRRKDEPVTELAEAVRSLMLLAYPGDQSNAMSQAVARGSFLSALNDPELEENVRKHEPNDLDEACRIAQRLEIIHLTVHAASAGQRGHQVRQVNEDVEGQGIQEDEADGGRN